MKNQDAPWSFLEKYRGRFFQGEWPTVAEMFEITCERFGERRAFTAFEPAPLSLSWKEVHGAVHRAAGYLLAHGVRAGDRVALTGKNSPEWAVALFADEEKLDALGASGARLRLSLAPGRPNYILQLAGSVQPVVRPAAETDTAAILFTSGTTGAEVVFGQKMVSKHIPEDLKRGRVTMFLGVPMLFNRLLIGIRICISGGGPLPASTFRQFNQLGIDFVQGYYRNEAATREVLSEDGWLRSGDVGYLDQRMEMTTTQKIKRFKLVAAQ